MRMPIVFTRALSGLSDVSNSAGNLSGSRIEQFDGFFSEIALILSMLTLQLSVSHVNSQMYSWVRLVFG